MIKNTNENIESDTLTSISNISNDELSKSQISSDISVHSNYKDNKSLYNSRIETKLQLRKINLQTELLRRKHKTEETKVELLINPNLLDITDTNFQNNFKCISEIFEYISKAYNANNENLLLHGVLMLRLRLTSYSIDPSEIASNMNYFYSLYDLLELYYEKKNMAATYEIIWITSNMFYFLSAPEQQTVMLSQKLIAVIEKILKEVKTPEFICTLIQLCGNAISNSADNREALHKTYLSEYLENFFKFNDFDKGICNSLIWYMSQTLRIKPELTSNIVSTIILFYINFD